MKHKSIHKYLSLPDAVILYVARPMKEVAHIINAILSSTMTEIKTLAFVGIIALAMIGCKNNSEKSAAKEMTSQQETVATATFSGNYVSASYEKRSEGYDWIAVSVKQNSQDEIAVSVRSRADKKKPTCTFDAIAKKLNANTFKALVNGKAVLFTYKDNSISISTENPDDSGILNFYCSGGASIAGEYQKINEPLDATHVDKTVFSRVLILQGIGFNISTMKNKSNEELTIRPFGLSIDNNPVSHTINGSVVNAEIEDLNSDGFPEVLIYTKSSNNDKGNVFGYSVNNGKSMSQITFPNIAENSKINQGYDGHDEFAIVETTLSRRFPIFEKGKKTGKICQIDYKLENGEASRIFVVKQTTEFNEDSPQ